MYHLNWFSLCLPDIILALAVFVVPLFCTDTIQYLLHVIAGILRFH